MTKYLIIGGVAGGASAAARIRRMDESATVILLERGEYISYANCGLPYHIGGTIQDRDRLFVTNPEKFKESLQIDVRVGQEALSIVPQERLVFIKNKKTDQIEKENYDRLLLSPGAEPILPSIPGVEHEGVFTLRSVPDMDCIQQYIQTKKPKKVLVVGAGFIGLEMAENFHQLGLAVTLVERQPQIMPPLDFEMAAAVLDHLQAKGVEVLVGKTVRRIDNVHSASSSTEENFSVELDSGEFVKADLILLSVGVRPDTRLAKEAGLRLEAGGAIQVNQYLQTSDPQIYAVGDAISFPSPIWNSPITIPLAGPASKQARIAADNMVLGNVRTYQGSIGTSIAKIFEIAAGMTGANEKQLRAHNIAFRTIITHSPNHAGYYPGSSPLSLKILFVPKTGKLLGAQCVGRDGVDKRLDVMSAFLEKNGSIHDMIDFEQTYAPPFSSSRDPINIAGMIAENVLMGRSTPVYWNEISLIQKTNAFILDVRTPQEFVGMIPGAVNIPYTALRTRLKEIPQNRPIVVFCKVGQRGYFAERILKQNGFSEVCNLSGGIETWESSIRAEKGEPSKNPLVFTKNRAKTENSSSDSRGLEKEVNACGLQCPGPILRLKTAIDSLSDGARLRILASDPGFARDVSSWCNLTQNTLISLSENKGIQEAIIEKSSSSPPSSETKINSQQERNGLTLVVFSNDFDRVLASFVIANGAAATGKKVTLFFTFWGLSVLRNISPISRKEPKKDFMSKMFGWMLPSNSKKLGLSKINFAGMGPLMMRHRMSAKNVDSLEKMIQTAQESGVHLVACQMSMDIMGLTQRELLPGVEVGGVAHYLEQASQSGINLFI